MKNNDNDKLIGENKEKVLFLFFFFCFLCFVF